MGDFMPDRGRGTVPGKNHRPGIQGKELFLDPREEKRPVTPGKIPPPNPLAKEDIPPDQLETVRKIKAETSRTMPGDQEDSHFLPGHLAGIAFLKEAVGGKRLDFQLESQASKKIPVGCHGGGIRMVGDLAPVSALDGCGVRRVVKMPVCQKKPVHLLPCKMLCGPLGGVKEDVSGGRFQKIGVGVEGATGKCFELIHLRMV